MPIPERGHVKTMENDDLLEVRTSSAGEAQTRVAFDTAPGETGWGRVVALEPRLEVVAGTNLGEAEA